MRKAKVFNSHGCTTAIHNALIDQIMPEVSGNAWKLLCLVVRQTDGWNRDEVGLSYRDLIAGMGVSSRGTVAAAVEELKPFGLLSITPGGKWEQTRYSLDLGAIVEWEPVNFNGAPVTKIGTGSVTEIGTAGAESPVTEIGTESVTEIGTDGSVTKIVLVPKIGTEPVTEIGTEPVTKIGTPPVTKIVPSYRKESNIEFTGKQSLPDATASGNGSKTKVLNKSASEEGADSAKSTGEKQSKIVPEFEIFAAAFLENYQTPYRSKKADFVQLDGLKKTCAGKSWDLTPERFRRAVENYFASEMGSHTFADLCTRFSSFYRGSLDRYGKPVNGAGGAAGPAMRNGKPMIVDPRTLTAKTRANAYAIQDFVEEGSND